MEIDDMSWLEPDAIATKKIADGAITTEKLNDGFSKDETDASKVKDHDGFKYLKELELIDIIFGAMSVGTMDQSIKPDVVVDPLLFIRQAVGENLHPGYVMKPECLRLVPSGKMFFYFSVIDGGPIEIESWLFGISQIDLTDAMPDFSYQLDAAIAQSLVDPLMKINLENGMAIGQRRRIVDSINEHLAVRYENRAQALQRQRENAKAEHYANSDDTGTF